jgi:integrase
MSSVSESNSKPRRTKVPGRPGVYRSVSGKYEFCYRDSDGKLRFKTVEGGVMDAVHYRAELVGKINKGERIAPSKVTFGDYAQEWYEGLAVRAKPLRPRTREAYRYHLDKHLLPRFERRKITSISTDDVARLVGELQEAGFGGWTIHGTLTTLSGLMGKAARKGLIASNPVRGLERDERPDLGQSEKRVLSESELGRLLASAGETYRPLISLLSLTGLRIAEALGLTWEDVDYANGVIHVRGQLDRKRKRVTLKTKQARRDVVLVPPLAKLLKVHRLASRFKAPSDFVFPAPDGRGADHRAAGRGIKRAVDRAGLGEGVSAHNLRHGFASMLIVGLKLDPVNVASQMGHASPTITLNTYSHLFEQARHTDDMRDALDQGYGHLLGGAS